jgi:hypothetical protein
MLRQGSDFRLIAITLELANASKMVAATDNANSAFG